jgi:hypothetical protein
VTALCGGGVSGPKAGVAETIIFTTSALASILNNRGGAWANIVAPLLGVLAYQATELCTVDPPADPGMTADDYLHLLRLDDLAAVSIATAKLAELAKRAIWYEVCECKTVATPLPPADLVAPPPDVGSPYAPGSGSCFQFTHQLEFPYIAVAGQNTSVFTYPLPDAVTFTATASNWTGSFKVVPRPTQWTHLNYTVEALTPYSGTKQNAEFAVVGLTALSGTFMFGTWGTLLVDLPGDPAPTYGRTIDTTGSPAPLDASFNYLAVAYRRFGAANFPAEYRFSLEGFCGAPGGFEAACLADASTTALLQQILKLLTLVQRQHVPFAYVPGLEYPGLTGNGEISFSDPILRAKIELTTLPGHYGMAEGHPDAIFDVGYVALGTADGFERARPIANSPMLLQVAGDVTKIGYSLNVGVVAKITTYSREP